MLHTLAESNPLRNPLFRSVPLGGILLPMDLVEERRLVMPVICPGCGLSHEALDLPAPDELTATGECVFEYGTVSATFYTEPLLVSKRQHMVDAYACQHPAVTTRRAVQRTALSLMTLDLVFGAGMDVAHGPRAHQLMMRHHPDIFTPLVKPDMTGTLTYRHVAAVSEDLAAVVVAQEEWARSVWNAWVEHHAQVRAWNEQLVPQLLR